MAETTSSATPFFKANSNRINASLNAHKDDEIKTGIVSLPSGIKSGIAELKQCYFKSDDKKTWLRAMAVIQAPETHNGIPIKGLQTSIMVSIGHDATEEEFDKAINRIREELCKLAGTNLFEKGGNFDLMAIAKAIENAHPMIRFSTSDRIAQQDNPAKGVKRGDVTGMWENWHGVVSGWKPAATANGPKTGVVEKPSANGHAKTLTEAKKSAEPEPDTFRDDEDLDSLGRRAAKDTKVQDRLRDMAKELGYTEEDLDNAPDYMTVVGWIKGGQKDTDSGTTSGPKYEKGNPVSYAPPDPKDETGTKRLKKVDCEVLSVNKTKKVYTICRLDDRKKKYEVAFDDANLTTD